jgi:hypothetical protein
VHAMCSEAAVVLQEMHALHMYASVRYGMLFDGSGTLHPARRVLTKAVPVLPASACLLKSYSACWLHCSKLDRNLDVSTVHVACLVHNLQLCCGVCAAASAAAVSPSFVVSADVAVNCRVTVHGSPR